MKVSAPAVPEHAAERRRFRRDLLHVIEAAMLGRSGESSLSIQLRWWTSQARLAQDFCVNMTNEE